MRARDFALAGLLLLSGTQAGPARAATENIEFVAEHIPEIAMDNRYATLPLWGGIDPLRPDAPQVNLTGGYSRTAAGELQLAGPMFAVGVSHGWRARWTVSAFGFFDRLRFSSAAPDRRTLDVSFTGGVPLALPVAAEFTDLGGSADHAGLGIAIGSQAERRFLGRYEWFAGLLWERLELRDYRVRYRVTEGVDADSSGLLDYSTTYSFATPVAGIAWPYDFGRWRSRPHLQLAIPLPRRGLVGRIAGPGFAASGTTSDVSSSRPFGDPSVTLGWDLTYRPWRLTVDVGSLVSQATHERFIHEGAGQNWLLSLRWEY
ncbi:MAG: hypothetical protein R3E72_01785 [Steroidobacteraceae bacterium]